MSKILILTDIGFSKRDYDRFGIEELKKNYEVKILDFTEIFFSNSFNKDEIDVHKVDNYYKVSNFQQSLEFIQSSNAKFVFDWTVSKQSYQLREFLKDKKIQTIRYEGALMPDTKRTLYEFIHKLFFLIFKIKKLINKILLRFNNAIVFNKKVFSYDYVIVSGKQGLNTAYAKNAKKLIFGHSMNFEQYLQDQGKENFIKKKNYSVFLDQCLPFHPGARQRGEKNMTTEKKYYPALNNFFSEFEKIHALKTIISVHSRSRYDLKPDLFYRREVSKFQTLELIKNSKVVIAHQSTAVSFAVLFKKPLIFLTTDEIHISFDDFRIDSLSRDLNSTLVNIDHLNRYMPLLKSEKIFSVDNNKYDQFKDDYIKFPGSKNKSVWDIFISNLN